MPEQRNLLLAILISVAILFGSQYFFGPDPDPTPPQQEAQNQQPGANGPVVPSTGVPTPSTTGLPSLNTPQDRAAVLDSSDRIAIRTSRMTGSIRLQGARFDDITLTDYHQTVDPASPPVELFNPANAPTPYFAEVGWLIGGQGITAPGPDTVWQADGDTLSEDTPVTLTWDNGEGLTFTQRFEVDENFMFSITHSVRNARGEPVTVYPYGRVRRLGTPEISDFFILHEGPLGVFEKKMELDYSDLRDEADGVIEESSPGGGWIGISDKYWMAALIPEQQPGFKGGFRHWAERGVDKYQVDFVADGLVVQPGASESSKTLLFAGAKEVDLISGYEEFLGIKLFDKAIDWGWFEFLTRPFFHAIDFFYSLLGNFGLAIIAVTFVVKFLFLPLAWKSYVSMAKMRSLQPEMVKLRERYPDDKMKLQQEMMALYKKNKVNPVSGCLPILLQIPVFFALYKVLFVTIEMRHAPFYGWINDLSAPDPTNLFELFGLIPWDTPELLHLGVWPILMGLSMFAQQKINPQPPDPMQARIMMMLPIVFTFFLARFPAGLVIYWTVNNLLSIAQQYFIMRRTNAKLTTAKTGD
ncbi:membrane protein insertase YidC [Minwuia sp.]|uniref:membrane protein insertase YidC n=1 Tax=Minwuia sp. TaxID=2493630 RepID=UPI003A953D2A